MKEYAIPVSHHAKSQFIFAGIWYSLDESSERLSSET